MVTIKDKQFSPFIDAETIQQRLEILGEEITKDFQEKTPILIGILNGSFMFISDLVKHISCPIEVSFIRISSYEGTESTGEVTSIMGLNTDLKDRHVIIVEDIVDTGLSMYRILEELKIMQPSSLSISTLLLKPDALKHPIECRYIGFEIPNKFVVGYGLDYDGLGRNLPEIYQLK
ncbi:hypoxanthine phosphoribosyltransferase [Mongoliitalea daihaiensis]|uniref:hypoxanthine phosphoribosyltransferase n=1 Tax=Mongoliitalea daihaiensis TaxID=2782006 RepID=UPI001F4707F8|nr:hypoxanthine phosphoribosyltransferase [Mongoliitalea daihaiensis]UJP65590.1 hypoxanthine phosphoribosyltransferase [Mongoliitalea daihaiensis]